MADAKIIHTKITDFQKFRFICLLLSDPYPAFFLLIATTSNKNF